MKRRGEDLRRHYRQAFDYWTRLVPGRPRYVVLCNFDEFWVYDFETQMDTPVDQLAVEDLPSRYGPLAFLFPNREKPTFGNDQEAVTRQAADRLATCFNKLDRPQGGPGPGPAVHPADAGGPVRRGHRPAGAVPRHPAAGRLQGAARQFRPAGRAVRGDEHAGRHPRRAVQGRRLLQRRAVRRARPDRALPRRARPTSKQAAKSDWSKVRPEIFGTLFEHSTDKAERHAFGGHFTSPVDIMKIVGPTIVEPWREQIEGAKTREAAAASCAQRMHHFTVLDPACGSGNFLYIAYRELKRLEARIHERICEMSAKADPAQRVFGFVTASNFFGMDINPFAVELAKVTMMIARKLAIDELHITEPALPLDNLDANFPACDALIDAAGNPTPWPKVDVIIGNPPFLGAKRLKPERGPDYVNAIRRAYPDVPGMADYCVYWFRKAHDHLPRLHGRRPRGRPGGTGRHAEHPQQPVARRRTGPHRQDRHDHRGGRQPALVGRGQRPRFHRRLGQDAGREAAARKAAALVQGRSVRPARRSPANAARGHRQARKYRTRFAGMRVHQFGAVGQDGRVERPRASG